MNLSSTPMIASFTCRPKVKPRFASTLLAALTVLAPVSVIGASPADRGCREAFSDYSNTIRACSVVIASPSISIPERARALQIRARARLASSNPKGAIADYTTAITLLPAGQLQGYLYYERGRARVLYVTEQFDQGLKDLEQANAQAPANTRILEALAQAYLSRSRYRDAVIRATQAYETDRRSVVALRIRAGANSELGKTHLVLRDLDALLELLPRDVDLIVWRGRTHQSRNNLHAALADYRRAARIRSDDDLLARIKKLERALHD